MGTWHFTMGYRFPAKWSLRGVFMNVLFVTQIFITVTRFVVCLFRDDRSLVTFLHVSYPSKRLKTGN